LDQVTWHNIDLYLNVKCQWNKKKWMGRWIYKQTGPCPKFNV